ncbi:MAG: polymer-forming cytoskeletal protein [Phycisphaeraceae bacterium]|nr:polymer-forming cytoskeletal protein [Phycisphaeraceae bacterium]
MSLRCPACTEPVALQDFVLQEPIDGQLSTMGQVTIAAACSMGGKVVCGHLVNQGRFRGEALVYGPVELDPQSVTQGKITAQSLKILLGARIVARVTIGPNLAKRFAKPPLRARFQQDPTDPQIPPAPRPVGEPLRAD